MYSKLKQLKWCILGGDKRDAHFAHSLLKCDYDVKVCGVPQIDELPGRAMVNDLEDAVKDADVLVCPVTGTHPQGVLRKSTVPIDLTAVLSRTSKLKVLVIGTANEAVSKAAALAGALVVESMRDDELAILNSIPSAEGAIQIAMENTDFTIHGSASIVLGMGRTGLTLASTLLSMHSNVSIAARKRSDLARGRALGFSPIHFDDLACELPVFDLIFNTVPSLVLDAKLMRVVKKTAVIIDLASPPGGTDFESAKAEGIKAILAPGLPGLVAPRTAGEILASVIPRLVHESLESLS